MKKTSAFLMLGVLGCTPAGSKEPAQPPILRPEDNPARPNVLFIMLDDMCDWAHYLGGNTQVVTPNLDRLAARSVAFANAYAAVPFSNPSRTALLTGMFPSTTGVYQNTHNMGDSPAVRTATLLPEHFHNNGYETIWAGKIFHTRPDEARLERMWDDMSSRDGGYGPWMKHMERPPQGMDWRGYEAWDGPDTDFPDIVNSHRIIEFLQAKHDKPFFAAIGIYRPHAPYTVPARFFDMYDPDSIELPYVPADDLDDLPPYALATFYPPVCDVRQELPQWREDGTWKKLVRAYLASVTFADHVVGSLLDALDASPYADNTIVVLLGDNGFHQGQKQRFSKMSLWREACHVPLIVSLPGGSGAEVVAPVSLLDIYPTLSSLCKLTAPEGLEGNDIAPLVKNPTMAWDKPCLSNYIRGNCTVHYKNWNYIRYADGSEELYDIVTDEDEHYNLAGKPEHRALMESLRKHIPTEWAHPLPATVKPNRSRTQKH